MKMVHLNLVVGMKINKFNFICIISYYSIKIRCVAASFNWRCGGNCLCISAFLHCILAGFIEIYQVRNLPLHLMNCILIQQLINEICHKGTLLV